jgi:hypothetical protein
MARPYLGGSSAGVKTLAASETLSMADSGKVFLCSQAGAYDITLPPASTSKGWTGVFILEVTGSNAFDIISDPADKMYGLMISGENEANGDEYGSDADKITFIAGTAVKGDRIDIVCGGSEWIAHAVCGDNAHIDFSG